jgi:hypothetical protein
LVIRISSGLRHRAQPWHLDLHHADCATEGAGPVLDPRLARKHDGQQDDDAIMMIPSTANNANEHQVTVFPEVG